MEIKAAAFHLGPLKAPRLDGFRGIFYKKYWEIVGPEVCLAIKSFFLGGHVPREWNYTNLVLIPKIAAPENLSQYRPISLCNFKMKIITKILANRLKVSLTKLISPQQATFIPGRLIQDSILVAHEGFHFLRQKKGGRYAHLALKLDFNKAYDRIQWDFLKAVLKRLGFYDTWIRWVMDCVITVQFSVVVNGENRAFFTPSCGLRQGDPLSPYLFILVAKILSKLITGGIQNKVISSLRMKRTCPILSHIFFADDVLLFLKASSSECSQMMHFLRLYNEASG